MGQEFGQGRYDPNGTTKVRLSCGCEDEMPNEPGHPWVVGDGTICEHAEHGVVDVVGFP